MKKGWYYLLWLFGFWKKEGLLTPPPPSDFVFPNEEETKEGSCYLSWINHSTFLIQYENIFLLTDPIWSKRCSPFNFLGPKRGFPPPISLQQLPHIDYVVISHNHYDHLDFVTVADLIKAFPHLVWIVPKGVKRWFETHFKKDHEVIELKWWEKISFQKEEATITFTSTPAQHFSGRTFWDRNETLWMGVMIDFKGSLSHRLYFSGDTGYNPIDFKEIGEKLGPMDLSILPIGTYIPRFLMQPVHLSPEEAVRVHCDVSSKMSVAAHWGCFHLSDEPLLRPPFDLFQALNKENIPCASFRVLKPGQKIHW